MLWLLKMVTGKCNQNKSIYLWNIVCDYQFQLKTRKKASHYFSCDQYLCYPFRSDKGVEINQKDLIQ